MQYMLMFNEPTDVFSQREDPGAAPAYWGAWQSYIAAMTDAGVMVKGDGLHGPSTATTVRVRDGRRQVEDGPFADVKEQLGGYVVIEVDDLDAAIGWAERAPAAMTAGVEVRPVLQRSEPA